MPGDCETVVIRDAASPTDLETIRRLFAEYQAWLDVDLCFQDFAQELATLPGRYAPPAGRLRLAEDIVAVAAAAGYRAMRLDSLRRLTAALALYRSLGFTEIGAYYDNPLDDVVYLERRLP